MFIMDIPTPHGLEVETIQSHYFVVAAKFWVRRKLLFHFHKRTSGWVSVTTATNDRRRYGQPTALK